MLSISQIFRYKASLRIAIVETSAEYDVSATAGTEYYDVRKACVSVFALAGCLVLHLTYCILQSKVRAQEGWEDGWFAAKDEGRNQNKDGTST